MRREQGIELEYEVELWRATQQSKDRAAVEQVSEDKPGTDSGKEQ